jgi:hypothetical protein
MSKTRRMSLADLRRLIREEIGRNYKTLSNDPVQYYDTVDAHYELFPAEGGWQVEIEVPGRPDLSPPTRLFPTEQEAILYGRQWFEKMRSVLGAGN